MRVFWPLLLATLTACAGVSHAPSTTKIDLSGYRTIAIGTVHFDPKLPDAVNLEQIFTEKLKTAIYQQGMGERYVKRAQADSVVVAADIESFDHGKANLRMAFGFAAGASEISGKVHFLDYRDKPLGTLNVEGMSPPAGGFIAGFADGQVLMRMVVEQTTTELKQLLGDAV